jgi:hypothetical protein
MIAVEHFAAMAGEGEGRATRYQHHGVPRFDAARPIIELYPTFGGPSCVPFLARHAAFVLDPVSLLPKRVVASRCRWGLPSC